MTDFSSLCAPKQSRGVRAFTIVELVIVVAVIVILTAVLIPTFAGMIAQSRMSGALQEAQSALKIIVADAGGAVPEGTIIVVADEEDGDLTFIFIYVGGALRVADEAEKATLDGRTDPDDRVNGADVFYPAGDGDGDGGEPGAQEWSGPMYVVPSFEGCSPAEYKARLEKVGLEYCEAETTKEDKPMGSIVKVIAPVGTDKTNDADKKVNVYINVPKK